MKGNNFFKKFWREPPTNRITSIATVLALGAATLLFIETRNQVEISQKAIDMQKRSSDSSFNLARKSAKLDSQTVLYEIRPYITLYSMDTTIINNSIAVSITFKNTGKTPAYKVIATGDIFAATSIPKDLRTPIGDTANFTHSIIGADNPFTIKMAPVFYYNKMGNKIIYTDNNITSIYKSKAFLFCGGRISYKDIFHNSYYTNFLLKYDYERGGFTPCKTNNDAN